MDAFSVEVEKVLSFFWNSPAASGVMPVRVCIKTKHHRALHFLYFAGLEKMRSALWQIQLECSLLSPHSAGQTASYRWSCFHLLTYLWFSNNQSRQWENSMRSLWSGDTDWTFPQGEETGGLPDCVSDHTGPHLDTVLPTKEVHYKPWAASDLKASLMIWSTGNKAKV